MIINIGTKNPIKTEAVKEVFQDYDFLKNSKFIALEVSSEVEDQPKSLDETVRGAMNRAKNAFKNCDLSIGIEDGLMKFPGTRTGYMNICICTIFDGHGFSIGTGPGFEYPPKITELVKKGMDINQASFELGLTKNPKVGSSEGTLGILTKGRMPRKDCIKYAIVTALIYLENKELFEVF